MKNMAESDALSIMKELKLPIVFVQKLIIGEKIYADGKEVGTTVFEENCCTPKLFLFSSDKSANSSLRKNKKISTVKKSSKRKISSRKHERKNLHHCSECSYSTYSKCLYNQHQRVHSEAFSCSLCSYKGEKEYNLKCHLWQKHPNQSLFDSEVKINEKHLHKCSLCTYSTYRIDHYNLHKRVHSNERPFTCPLCSYKFKRKDHLKRHSRRMHSNQSSHTTDTKDSEFHKCPHCIFTTKRKCNFDHHMLKHSVSKQYKCEYCSYNSNKKSSLKSHMTLHKSSKSHTSYDSNKKSSLKSHMTLHKSSKSHTSYDLNKKSSLKSHMTVHKSSKSHTSFEGDHVEKMEVDTKFSGEHMDDSFLKCPDCNFKTKRKSAFIGHRSRHTNQCFECDFETTEESELDSHILSHTNTKVENYSDFDSESEYSFKTEDINDHAKAGQKMKKNKQDSKELPISEVHDTKNKKIASNNLSNTEEKNKLFKCSKCEFETKYKNSVVLHMSRKHSDKQPMNCSKCDFSTKQKNKFEYHLQSHVETKLFERSSCDLETDSKKMSESALESNHEEDLTENLQNKDNSIHKASESCISFERDHVERMEIDTKLVDDTFLKCPDCEFKTKEKSAFIDHTSCHTNKTLHKCFECDFETKEETEFDSHILSHAETKAISNSNSEAKNDINSEKNVDDDKVDNKMIKNKQDNNEFPNSVVDDSKTIKNYENELPNEEQKKELFKCSRCDFGTKFMPCLKRHMLKKHKRSPRVKGKLKSDLQEHMDLKSNDDCRTDCDFQTKHKSHSLKNTNNTLCNSLPSNFETTKEAKLISQPMSCTKETVNSSDIVAETEKTCKSPLANDAKVEHKSERWEQCSKCSFKVKNKRFLESHMRTHDVIKSVHECVLCSYRTISKQNLKLHMFKHSNFKLDIVKSKM